MVRRKRFWIRDIEPRSVKPTRTKCIDECMLLHGGTATNVVENGAALNRGQACRINEVSGLRIIGQEVDHMIGAPECLRQLFSRDGDHAFVAARVTAHRPDLHFKRSEEL